MSHTRTLADEDYVPWLSPTSKALETGVPSVWGAGGVVTRLR